MTDPEQRKADRNATDGVPDGARPVQRGVRWGVIFAWIFAIIVVLYIISVIVGNLDGRDVTETRSPLPHPDGSLVQLYDAHDPSDPPVVLHA